MNAEEYICPVCGCADLLDETTKTDKDLEEHVCDECFKDLRTAEAALRQAGIRGPK